ncbi:SEN34 subunit of tRNA-splicing endonuclease [Thozetella sp. PMI_491]|nr:SEN34 subunit of tRNA-splicing endonuclease [Thozetella sp. PMI_491]
MDSSTSDRPPVRLSKIAGRYLVFDLDDVMYLRRSHNICAVFTGTIPQAPSQNVFLSLPIELYAEEARFLVDKKAAYVADDPVAQLSQLKTVDETARKAYIQSLRTQRKNASQIIEQEQQERLAKGKEIQKRKGGKRASQQKSDSPQPSESTCSGTGALSEAPSMAGDESLFDGSSAQKQVVNPPLRHTVQSITPNTSAAFINPATNQVEIAVPKSYPLYAHLHSKGFFVTPGLRFGADYSVYPGDPFRYHAHFMANSYGWDEGIPMLDLIACGRLGTSVKKSFLFGGQAPSKGQSDEGGGADVKATPEGDVRAFCIEWAGM